MGRLRFLVPDRERVSPLAIETAHVCGRDHNPWVSRVVAGENGELVAQREENESGTFNILWSVAGRESLLLSTATLMERQQPYQLPLELARGTLNRLQNLLADWQASGMDVPETASGQLHEALHSFVQAVATQASPLQLADWADRSISAALTAIDTMSAAIVEQVRQARQRQPTKVMPLFVGRLGAAVPDAASSGAFATAFNTAAVPFSWGRIEADEGRKNWSLYDAQVQWCQTHGLRICGGPLMEIGRQALPDWIYLWEGDFENLLMVAGDYVRGVVQRFRGKVHYWNAAGRLITGTALGLNEEQKLRLVVRTLEVIRAADPQTPVIVSFDQPWAEFMARRESELPPLQFADALVRADLGISGVGMEINLGTNRQATLPRDPLEFNCQLDRWSALGLPLLVTLAVPSAGDGFTPQRQQAWLETYVPLVLARPTVQALVWNQWLDREADEFPHTGLVDAAGQIKPALAALAALRKQYSA